MKGARTLRRTLYVGSQSRAELFPSWPAPIEVFTASRSSGCDPQTTKGPPHRLCPQERQPLPTPGRLLMWPVCNGFPGPGKAIMSSNRYLRSSGRVGFAPALRSERTQVGACSGPAVASEAHRCRGLGDRIDRAANGLCGAGSFESGHRDSDCHGPGWRYPPPDRTDGREVRQAGAAPVQPHCELGISPADSMGFERRTPVPSAQAAAAASQRRQAEGVLPGLHGHTAAPRRTGAGAVGRRVEKPR